MLRRNNVLALVRWLCSISLIGISLFFLNSAAFAAWQTGTPTGMGNVDNWTQAAYASFWLFVFFLCLSAVVFAYVRASISKWHRTAGGWCALASVVSLAAALASWVGL